VLGSVRSVQAVDTSLVVIALIIMGKTGITSPAVVICLTVVSHEVDGDVLSVYDVLI